MNKYLNSMTAIAIALALGACEAPAPAGKLAQQAKEAAAAGTTDTGSPSDSLNCKIEMLNDAAVPADKVTDALPVHGAIKASGWVMLKDGKRAPADVVVEFAQGGADGAVVHEGAAAERVDRPDVDTVFSAPAGSKAGFVFQLPAAQIADGPYLLRIVGKDAGNRYPCPNTVQIDFSAAAAD